MTGGPRTGAFPGRLGSIKRFACACACLAVLASSDARADAADLRDVAHTTIRQLGLQSELPLVREEDEWHFQVPPEVLRIVLWGAIILGVAVVAWSMRDSLPVFSRSRRIQAGHSGAAPAAGGAPMDIAQLEADELARAGRYADAIHVLLLQSLTEMRRRLDVRFGDSLTSREILRMARLPGQGRAALGNIVAEVERTYFGAHGASDRDYANCRMNFEALKAVLVAGPLA